MGFDPRWAEKLGKHLPESLPLDLSEATFQAAVIGVANHLGWAVAHFRRVRVQRKNGETYYETPVAADGKGFPDLLMVRAMRCLVAELKAGKNKPTPEQAVWIERFRGTLGVEAYVWRPVDWPEILGVLQ